VRGDRLTWGNLQLLRNEHGELIARNHEELECCCMGERDYFEFADRQGKHVGSMQDARADKRHQFTVRRRRLHAWKEELSINGSTIFTPPAAGPVETSVRSTRTRLRLRRPRPWRLRKGG
jgi:hypothetical protein